MSVNSLNSLYTSPLTLADYLTKNTNDEAERTETDSVVNQLREKSLNTGRAKAA
jgi:hypothetical protein